MHGLSYWLSHESDVNQVIVRLLQVALVAAVVGLARAWPRTGRDAFAVAMVLVFAMSRRLAWAPLLRNENQHGWMYFTDVACQQPLRDLYGFGYFALHTPFLDWFGATVPVLLWVQFVISVITPWLVLSVARGMGWSRSAASLAGLLVAGSDLLARMGRSEDRLVLAIACLLLAADRALAWLAPVDDDGAPVSGHVADLAAAVGAFAVATQTRPELYVVAPAFLAVVIGTTPAARAALLDPARRGAHAVAAIGGAVVLALPLHNLLWKLAHGEHTAAHTLFDAHGSFLDRLLNRNLPVGEVGNVLLVDTLVPPFVLLAAALGLVLLVLRRPAQGLAFAAFGLLILRLWLPAQGAPEGAARLQQLPVLLACLLGGYGLAEAARALLRGSADRPPLVAVVMVLFLGGGLTAVADPAASSNNAVAQRIAQAGILELPDHADLILPLGDRVVNSNFLECHEALVARDVRVFRMAPNDTFPSPAPGRPQVFWQGTPCWSFGDAAQAAGQTMRSECVAARRRCPSALYGLEDTVRNHNADIVAVPADELTLGFYACPPP